jgi:hypothetical protein
MERAAFRRVATYCAHEMGAIGGNGTPAQPGPALPP